MAESPRMPDPRRAKLFAVRSGVAENHRVCPTPAYLAGALHPARALLFGTDRAPHLRVDIRPAFQLRLRGGG